MGKERNSGKNRSSIKHLEKIVDIERTRSRDLKDDLDRDRRYRRDRKSRRERDRSKSRYSRLRLYRERSRSKSRSRDYRRSRSHRSRSRHRRPDSSPADRRSERFTAHRSTQVQVKTEPNINPNFSLPQLNQDYYPPEQQVVAPYQPYFMTTPPETFSSLIAGLLTAAQTPQGLTPPPTPEEF